ncbi:MAG: alpha-L-rhamnosidase [Armatimonadetes bacterium]|nr:alpha-L-rhamnosidase [Armatimonadota bacterium]
MYPLILTLGLLADAEPPMRVFPYAPVTVARRADGVWFVDFGRAWYGTLELRADVAQPTQVTVHLGEKLGGPQALDAKPPGSVIYRSFALDLQPGRVVHRLAIPAQPRHSDKAAVHMPASIGEVTVFRAAEIAGWPGELTADQVRLLAVHVPHNPDAASFECSDPTLNRVWELCRHTIVATTAFGVYIDGERERIPYEADAYLNQLSHYAVDAEYETARRTFEHLLAQPTWPTEWSLHMPLVAHADWMATGSAKLADDHWDALRRKLLMDKARPDGLLAACGIVDWPVGERDGYGEGKVDPHDKRQVGPEVNTVVNAFYLAAVRATAELAEATGRVHDAVELRMRYAQALVAFQGAFYDEARGVYVDGEGCAHASLHGNAFALAFGLVPAQHRDSVADFVVSRGMACSVYGAQYLLDGLFAAGRGEAAVKLLRASGPRSWANMLNVGSTMTLEAWDAKFKGNLTWNHAWGAAPANLCARWVLGVQPAAPGYAKVVVRPHLGGLAWAKGRVPTPRGPVTVDVDRATGRYEVTVPAGVELVKRPVE